VTGARCEFLPFENLTVIDDVLSRYDLGQVFETTALGNAGGFSGCAFWRVRTIRDSYCLRRWPPGHPRQSRLEFIHRVLRHVYSNGCTRVAAPLPDRDGNTFVRRDGFFWELNPWISGKADFCDDPSPARLASAIATLADFHSASARLSSFSAPSKNVNRILDRLAETPKSIDGLRDSVSERNFPELDLLCELVLNNSEGAAARLQQQLRPFAEVQFRNLAVIRDVWHDHVFFDGDSVSGIVDFGAMEIDIISLDLARLLGSLVPRQPSRIQIALDQYSAAIGFGPISLDERRLVPILDECGVLIGAINWLRWLLVEHRVFENQSGVRKRVDFLSCRLRNMI
jgi:homoserine kinase type II